MSIEVREAKGVVIIHPTSTRVTAVTGAQEFRDAVTKTLEDGHLALAINLEGIEYADSTMIGVLITAFKKLSNENGLMCLYGVGPDLHEFFRQTVLDRFIEICEDEETALDLFTNRPKNKRRGLRRLFS